MSPSAGPAAPPSLLGTLLARHLDPGYAAAHRSSRHGGPAGGGSRSRPWLAAGMLVVGLLVGVAATAAAAAAPDTAAVQSGLVSNVEQTRRDDDTLRGERDALAQQVDTARRDALAGNQQGRAALEHLAQLQRAAGASAVRGPGVQVTLSDTGGDDRRGTVLDRDLQQAVNALWAAGAEAVSVGGVRLGPTSTIRLAGGAMLVDQVPVPSPYVVSAVGGRRDLQTGFLASPTYQRLSAVAQVYGVGLAVVPAAELQLPAAVAPELREASPGPVS